MDWIGNSTIIIHISDFSKSFIFFSVTELVQTRLIESGWTDQVKLACRNAILEKRNPTVDELITEITPKARAMVPDAVKRELLRELEIILVNVDKAGYSKSF